MQDWTTEKQSAFHSGTQKYLTLTFDTVKDGQLVLDNSFIASESMELVQSICEESQLTFGKVYANEFTIKIFNQISAGDGTITEITQELTDATLQVKLTAGDYTINIGTFYVDEDKITDDKAYRELTCYSMIGKVISEDYSEWLSSVECPITFKGFRDAFFEYIGIEQETISLPNDNVEIPTKNFQTDAISGSDIIGAILEANGCFGFENCDGKFQYVFITSEFSSEFVYPSNDKYPSATIFPSGRDILSLPDTDESAYEVKLFSGEYIQSSLKYEEFMVNLITKVVIRDSDDDVGGSYGKDRNNLIIQGNFLFYAIDEAGRVQAAKNILSRVKKITYYPGEFEIRAMPWIDLGDVAYVKTRRRNIVFPILKRTISGISNLIDKFEASGSKDIVSNTNSISKTIERINSKTLELKTSVEEVSSTMTEISEELHGEYANKAETESMIKQSVDTINLMVKESNDGIQELRDEVLLYNSMYLDNGDNTTTVYAQVFNDSHISTEDFPSGWYKWKKKTESQNVFLGWGYSIVVDNTTFDYGGIVDGIFETFTDDVKICVANGDNYFNLAFADGTVAIAYDEDGLTQETTEDE